MQKTQIEFNLDGSIKIPRKIKADIQEIKTSIKPDRMPFDELMYELDKGFLVIPAFQRDFIWGINQSILLLDSIYNGYPVGSFLIWDTEKDMQYIKEIGDYELNKPSDEGGTLSYILDGQQRIASLYACLKEIRVKDKIYMVYFDLDDQKFVAEQGNEEGRYVKFSEVFGKNYLGVMRSLTDERQEIFEKLHQAFKGYNFSIIRIKGQPIEVVCEIFERINNTGTELTVVDLVVAKTWSQDFDLRKKLKEYGKKLEVKHFAHIDGRYVLQCISVHNFGRSHRREILKLSANDLKHCWDESLNSISMAIDFIKNNLNIQDSKILPFPSLIIPISYFFYKNSSPTQQQINYVFKWFWKASLSNRFDSGVDTKIADDIAEFNKILENKEPKFEYQYSFNTKTIANQKFSTGNAFCKTILSMFAYMRPKNLKNNLEIDLNSAFSKYNSKEMHHFFPKGFLIEQGVDGDEIERITNICFLPYNLNREISKKSPKEYITELKESNLNIEDALKSHLIDIKTFGITENNFNKFIEERAKLIERKLKQLADIEEFKIIEDDQLVSEIIHIESLLRNLVKRRLDIMDKKWYKNTNYLKKEQFDKIYNNLLKDLERNPNIKEEDVWDYIDIGIIIEIFDRNKDIFKDIFKKNFVDYSFVTSLIRLMNKVRSKETHGKTIYAVTETDIETLKLQLPLFKKTILDFFNSA